MYSPFQYALLQQLYVIDISALFSIELPYPPTMPQSIQKVSIVDTPIVPLIHSSSIRFPISIQPLIDIFISEELSTAPMF